MQVKIIAECSAILLTFIKSPFVIKIFVLSIFDRSLKTGFTVHKKMREQTTKVVTGGKSVTVETECLTLVLL